MRDDSKETLPICGSSYTSLFKVNICMNVLMYVLRNDIVYEGIGGAANTLENQMLLIVAGLLALQNPKLLVDL